LSGPAALPRLAAHGLIRAYQLTLSSLVGRQCRYLPTCSQYADQAILRHGLWAGGWVGLARICRCHPWGGRGFDPPPQTLPNDAGPFTPWRYGQWRFRCEPAEPTFTDP
jgi:putative membrane protein insertion efficiency factor